MQGPASKHRAARLERQAQRTSLWRHPLYARAGVEQARDLLDVGCGNGAVTRDLARLTSGRVVAVDDDPAMVEAARRSLKDLANVTVQAADAHRLPMADASFDVAVCNLVLMWVREPVAVLKEMRRVVRPGGVVLASMEPDYGGKVHYPENPVVDQIFQGKMIERKGGDPHAGRKLRAWFVQAGLKVEVGMSNPRVPECAEDLESYHEERAFYTKALVQSGLTERQVDAWEKEYVASLSSGVQFNFLPLFYALGTTP